jgi:hypothetical protein
MENIIGNDQQIFLDDPANRDTHTFTSVHLTINRIKIFAVQNLLKMHKPDCQLNN